MGSLDFSIRVEPSPLFRTGLSVLSAILFILAFPPFHFYLLGWIGLIPLMLAVEGFSLKNAYLQGTLMGFVLIAGAMYWLAVWGDLVVQMPVPLNYLVLFGYAFAMGQVFGVICWLVVWIQAKRSVPSVFLWPVIQVSVFSLYPMLFYFKLADSQSHFLPALQGLDLTGVQGLDLMMVLFNALLFMVLFQPKKRTHLIVGAGGVLLLILWFAYGSYRQSSWDEKIGGWSVKKVGLVQTNRPATLSRPKPEEGYSRLYPLEMAMTQDLAAKGAEIVIWPEGNFFGYVYWDQVRASFKKYISEMQIPILFHDTTFEQGLEKKYYFNSSLLLNHEGEEVGRYHKMVRVPFGEYTPLLGDFELLEELLGDYLSHLSAGTEHKTFDAAGMRIVPFLCYEALFPEFIADAVGADASGKVLVVQSQDGWYGETNAAETHLAISGMRAIENRLPLVHVINNGPSAVVLPQGHYLFMAPAFEKGGWVINMPYDPGSGGSFYSQNPYFFLSLIWTLFGLLVLFRLLDYKNRKP